MAVAPVRIKIKRFDKSLPAPERKTAGAAAYDLCARVDTVIPACGFGLVPLNVAVELPEGYWALLGARSSLHKRGLIPANGIGIIDRDYCGDDDEYMAVLHNTTEAPITVTRGLRVVQLVIMTQHEIELVEVERLGAPNRGGFGTTGSH
ncbi:MAG TPA: deoxyuridine 5'-triphosphate nucleotidohydrolase [Candidatus Saccharimonadales bacterium]|nr:deoxyuridine 5'-triphosphate nucleotidohydrolase [Candidatus Saccharimonadales bacterium]